MRMTFGLAAALCAGLLATVSFGAEDSVRQPTTIRQVAFEYDAAGYMLVADAAQPTPAEGAAPSKSPSDAAEKPAPKPLIQPEAAPTIETPVSSCYQPSCCDPVCCDPCDFGCCSEKKNPFTWGGWVSAGIYANGWGTKNNGPLTMREYANGATVDQTWFYFEKAIDNGGCGFDWGGRVDFMWGADGPDTQCFGDGGWDGQWFTSDDQNYGSAMPQLYGEVAYNNLSIKIGHFYTIIGYEVVPAPDNFFYSHSDTLAIEPFTHTGALASYKYNDRITLHGGWVNGWDNGWLDPSGASTFLGGASLDLTEKTSVTYATSFGTLWNSKWGNHALGGSFDNNGYLHSIVLESKLTDRLTYVFQSDFLTTCRDTVATIDAVSASSRMPYKSYGINQYLFYELNEKWQVGMRAEWIRYDFSQTTSIGNVSAYGSQTTNRSNLTFGLNYKPLDNVVIRPEIRWDWGEGAPATPVLYNDGVSSHQFSGGFDVIVTY